MIEFLQLDIKTLSFGACVLGFLFAALSLIAANTLAHLDWGLRAWGCAMACTGAAMALYLVRNFTPVAFSLVIPNVFILIAGGYGVLAHARLLDRPVPRRLVWVTVALGTLGFVPILFWGIWRPLGQATQAFAMATCLGTVAFLISRDHKMRSLSAKVGVTIFALTALAFLARGAASSWELIAGEVSDVGASRKLGLLSFSTVFVVSTSICFFWLVSDRLRREMLAASQRDGLTGLLTRAVFFEHAEELTGRPDSHYAIVMVDIDHFKQVNDRHGHQGGDLVLSHAARRIASEARITDLAGRYGGEEFCILLPDCDEAQALSFAERLVEGARTQAVRLRSGDSCSYTLSAGVAAHTGAGTDSLQDVIEHADKALYAAKHGGRNRALCAGTLLANKSGLLSAAR